MRTSIIIIVAIAATFAASFVVRRRALVSKLCIELAAWVIISSILFPLVGSALQPEFAPDTSAATFERMLVAVWWLRGARVIIMIARLGFDRQQGASRLLFDLASGAVHVGAVLITLNLAFAVSVTSLVATSGILAIVLGLALQNTLGDLFSGIAISVERPFWIGDYIWIEGAMEGVVIETNWRATRLVTDTNDIATIPNSVVAKGRILNRSRPTEIRTEAVRLILDPSVAPERAIGIIRAAVLTTPGIATTPPPSVVCKELRGEGTVYEAFFSAPRRSLGSVRSHLLQKVALHTKYAGVAFAMQNNVAQVRQAYPDGVQLMRHTLLFEGLSDSGLQTLASKLIARRGEIGSRLFEQGASKLSLFMIAEGVFEVLVDTEHGSKCIGTIAPGDHVGELSLLVGALNPATVKAITPFLAYELTKQDLGPLLNDHPDILKAFEAGAVLSMERLDERTAEQAQGALSRPANLIERIRAFFDLPH